MGNRAAIAWIGVLATAGASYFVGTVAALIVGSCTIIMLAIHALEVKINKLLDDRGIFVSQEDLRD